MLTLCVCVRVCVILMNIFIVFDVLNVFEVLILLPDQLSLTGSGFFA